MTARGEDETRRMTINDVARLAKVSKKTISRVINNSPLLKRETRDRVLKIIEEVGYQPDPQARGLAFRRSFLIGLIYDNPNAQYVIDMQQGVLDVIRGSGYELLVHPCSRQHPNFLSDIRKFVERQRLFGVVLPPRVSDEEGLTALFEEIGCPFVRIAAVALDVPSRMVVTHDRRGAAAAVRHLADLGHTAIGHVSGPATFRSVHERHGGVIEGLASRGLEFDPRYYAEGGYTFESGIVAGRALLALDPRPTAIFAGNDEMAAGIYRAAREAGLDIPRDLSVIGFDDSPVATKVWPPLTTVRLPIREMGAIAARRLLAQAPGAPPEGREILVEPALVVRQSAAPLLSQG
ncbi:MAG TPA: LacI family DNA-binding transcriptional regulator [Magnetospirillaceae bacterium]|nr:LacI family DNA-binding transcriptional regulator [Magnetospirillaceae bacterium]